MKGRFWKVVRWAAAICWIAAVVSYWQQRVPPQPAHVIPLQGRTARWTPGFGETIVLCQRGEGESRATGFRGERMPPTMGPLQFYDPATARLLKETLTEDDEILAIALKPREVAIVLRDESVLAVDLADGRELCRLTAIQASSRFTFADGARIVICQKGRSATAFDLEKGQQLWSRDDVGDVQGTGGGGCEAIVVRRLIDVPGPECWNARTGETDVRFRTGWPISASEDGSRFVLVSGAEFRIFDSRLGRELTRVTVPRTDQAPSGFRLDREGKSLFVWSRDRSGHHTARSWSCDTGKEIEVPASIAESHGSMSADSRIVLTSEEIPSISEVIVRKLPTSLSQKLQKSKLYWDLMVRANRGGSRWCVLTDTATNQVAGRYEVPTFVEWMLVVDRERQAAAFGDIDSISCYAIPPATNWNWLLKWGALPIVVVIGLGKWWHWWKGRKARQDAAASAAGLKPAAQ